MLPSIPPREFLFLLHGSRDGCVEMDGLTKLLRKNPKRSPPFPTQPRLKPACVDSVQPKDTSASCMQGERRHCTPPCTGYPEAGAVAAQSPEPRTKASQPATGTSWRDGARKAHNRRRSRQGNRRAYLCSVGRGREEDETTKTRGRG